jgi:uncharacterized protein
MEKNLFSGIEELGFDYASKLNIFEDKTKLSLETTQEETKEKKDKFSSMLYDKEITCPVCGSIFKARAVKIAASKVKNKDSDFFTRYLSINPFFYDIYLCNKCGYASMKRDFKNIREAQIELVKEKISPKWTGKKYPELYDIDVAIERYKLALLNCVIINSRSSKKALNCLKLSWMYRLKSDAENELAFLREALKGFSDAFYSEKFPIQGMDRYTIMYLIGELHRRTGNSDDALLWLSEVITSQNVENKLKDLARDQRDIIKNKEIKSKSDLEALNDKVKTKKGFFSRFLELI